MRQWTIVKRWVIRIASAFVVLIALVVVTGSAYEFLRRHQARLEFPPTAFIPQEQNQSLRDVQMVRAYGPTSLGPMLVEYDAINATLAEAGTFRQLGNRPLFVLTAMQPFSEEELQQMKITAAQGEKDRAIWKEMQDDEATWSSRSQYQLVYDSSYYIQFYRPDRVINAVLSVVDTVRVDAAH